MVAEAEQREVCSRKKAAFGCSGRRGVKDVIVAPTIMKQKRPPSRSR